MDTLKNELVQNVLVPIILLLGSSIVLIAKHYIKKITESILAKNELSMMLSNMNIKNGILSELGTMVQSAVFTNMKLANSLKENGKKLTEVEANMLQESAKKLVYNALPTEYEDENSAVLKLVGGKQKLDNIISNMIEGAVITAKNQM